MMEFKLSKKFSADSSTSEKYADVLIHVADKKTVTTEDRLADIDFEVIVTNDKSKVYKCSHCEETRIELAAAEKHFILKHQDCGNAPEVLERAIKNYKASQNNFEDIKKQIKNSCNLDLAKNKLM